MSGIRRIFNKLIGYQTPNVSTTIKESAPQLDQPPQEVKSPELGGQTEEDRQKRKGKSQLKIEPSVTTKNTGLNVG